MKSILEELEVPSISEFYFVAPNRSEGQYFYALYMKTAAPADLKELKRLQVSIEEKLRENYHYRYARHLKQLAGFRIYLMNGDCERAYYDTIEEKEGIRLGDIKYLLLNRTLNFYESIEGCFL